MSGRRRRGKRSGIRTRYDGSFMSEAKTDRQFTPNDIINSIFVSSGLSRIDVFSQYNVVVAEYNHGRRLYFEPCLNRLCTKVNGKFYKLRRRQARAEGW